MRSTRRLLIVWSGIGFALVCAVAVSLYLFRDDWANAGREAALRSYEELTGSRFLPLPANPFQPPIVHELEVPAFAGANGIWGSTGRDDAGGIWIGVSAGHEGTSAHLMHLDPVTGTWRGHGAVVDQLKAAGLHAEGEGQAKIHSRIVAADDGWLYFASMDEQGENAAANVPPRWGGHLWRIDPRTSRWQHLFAAREGLIAATGVGRYVYTLGYWGHVLYQYDTLSGAAKRVAVGSARGHVSRNFIADVRGHAYVPRVSAQTEGRATAALIEYNVDLQKVASTPLDFYLGNESPEANHGIVGFAYLADGRIAFTTHRGRLYLLDPTRGGPATLTDVGWLHPRGEAYAPSLFSFSGKSLLAGVTQREGRFEWVVFDLRTGVAAAFPFNTGDLRNVLLYGSISRDDAGRFYVVGWARDAVGGQRPLVLQVSAAP